MEGTFIVPQNYEQWLRIFSVLGTTTVPADNISELRNGICPGIEKVTFEFQKRLQETTNQMLTRITKKCTSAVNITLEERDFENIEVVMRRYRGEMKNCRFYLYINFLSSDYIEELDNQVTREIERYWKELQGYLWALVEETEDSRLYDMVYYLKRIK